MKPGSIHNLVGTVDVVIIGAGHAGLAMSQFLSAGGVDHVILERGEVANSWRTERWDSLKLLTPNWQSRLPGYQYAGGNPDAYMNMHEVIDFISTYATHSQAPVRTHCRVESVVPSETGYRVVTARGEWHSKAVILASGACNLASVPALSQAVPDSIKQLTPMNYRNPEQLDQGGVLVVGASATGLQLAQEIQQSGRQVTLAVGEHVRVPRMYRGRDIQWWMDTCGILDEGLDDVDDINRVRRLPSPQLIGSTTSDMLDLNALSAIGVRSTGRLVGIRDGQAQFSGALRNICSLADLKMNRLLDKIDTWIDAYGHCSESPAEARPEATKTQAKPCLGLKLADNGIRSVIWATGYRPDYSWLKAPVVNHKGALRHQGGIVDAPGLYALGLPFMRRRKSTFIHGIEDDTHDIYNHLKSYLDCQSTPARLRLAG